MNTKFEYYYNNVPGKGLCRNNLIYTSLISKDCKTFCQWFHNDTEYHQGQNQVVDPSLMNEKFEREVRGLTLMYDSGCSDLIPEFDVDLAQKKIYLSIDGPDMWERAGCAGLDYSSVVEDWDEQMLEIFRAHRKIGLYKYSLHPSSYFIVDRKIKSMNYFFTYDYNEKPISLRSVMSHISTERQEKLFPKMKEMCIDVDKDTPHREIQILAFESFKSNFDSGVMETAKNIYSKKYN